MLNCICIQANKWTPYHITSDHDVSTIPIHTIISTFLASMQMFESQTACGINNQTGLEPISKSNNPSKNHPNPLFHFSDFNFRNSPGHRWRHVQERPHPKSAQLDRAPSQTIGTSWWSFQPWRYPKNQCATLGLYDGPKNARNHGGTPKSASSCTNQWDNQWFVWAKNRNETHSDTRSFTIMFEHAQLSKKYQPVTWHELTIWHEM
jgi:hypothetical protein